jgi:hypothetical protein
MFKAGGTALYSEAQPLSEQAVQPAGEPRHYLFSKQTFAS